MNRPARTRLAAAAVAPLLVFGLVACGDSDDDDRDDDAVAPAASTSASVPESSAAAPSDDASTSAAPSEPASAPAGDGTLLTAAATGLGAVQGGTVFSVDRRDTGDWEVNVVTDDGTEQDVTVSADGATVTAGPVEDTDDGDDDGTSDRDERLRLLDASVDLEAAVEAASGEAGGAELTGADLDEDNGTATWEVQYGEDTPDELTVTVDANTGDVLRTERDD